MQGLNVIFMLFCSNFLNHCSFGHGNQGENLKRLLKSRRSQNPSKASNLWRDIDVQIYSPVTNIMAQEGLMEADKIKKLPGQPYDDVDFNHYSGYVTIDEHTGKSLFYYFVESSKNSSTKPLLLWLNGGQ